MEFNSQDVIETSSIFKYGRNSPLVTTEVQELIKDKLSLISEHYRKDDELFRKNCVEVFEFFFKERKKWELIYFIRCTIEEKIYPINEFFPEFSYDDYSPLVNAARCFKEENE